MAVGRATGLSPQRLNMPNTQVGGSPFAQSIANSSFTHPLSTVCSTIDKEQDGVEETDEDILAFFDRDYNERGDGGDSDEEGDEINVHNESRAANFNEILI